VRPALVVSVTVLALIVAAGGGLLWFVLRDPVPLSCPAERGLPAEWRERWHDDPDDREWVAEAIGRCGVLDGATLPELRAALGPAEGRLPVRTYHAGTICDGIGPGDAAALTFVLGSDGRVQRVRAPRRPFCG
jgi:hypothetical protein